MRVQFAPVLRRSTRPELRQEINGLNSGNLLKSGGDPFRGKVHVEITFKQRNSPQEVLARRIKNLSI